MNNEPKQKIKPEKKSENESQTPVDKIKEEKKKKFLEFLQVMKGNKQSWNDDARQFDVNLEKDKTTNKKTQPKNIRSKKEPEQDQTIIEEKELKSEIIEPETKDNLNDKIDNKETSTGKFVLPVDEKRLFVLNFPYTIIPEDVEKVFKEYGVISELKLPKDKDGKYKGFGYVTYQNEDSAVMAFSELDNKVVFVS